VKLRALHDGTSDHRVHYPVGKCTKHQTHCSAYIATNSSTVANERQLVERTTYERQAVK